MEGDEFPDVGEVEDDGETVQGEQTVDEKGVIGLTVHPATFLRQPPKDSHTIVSASASVSVAPPSPTQELRTARQDRSPSSPLRHKATHRQRSQSMNASAPVVRLTLQDLEHHEKVLPENIAQPVLDDLLSEVEKLVVGLAPAKTQRLTSSPKSGWICAIGCTTHPRPSQRRSTSTWSTSA